MTAYKTEQEIFWAEEFGNAYLERNALTGEAVAGRELMSQEMQALCFFAGANLIFSYEKLLTANNVDTGFDRMLFDKLGLRAV